MIVLLVFLLASCKKDNPLPHDDSARTAAIDKYLKEYVPHVDYSQFGWLEGSEQDCKAGRHDDKDLERTYGKLMYYRQVAGYAASDPYPVAGLYANESDRVGLGAAQESALMMLANNTISHYPPRNWKCYTEEGKKSSKGNLAITWGFEQKGYMRRTIDMFIDDFGGGNEPVGHRQWFFHPLLDRIFSGATNRTANIYWSVLKTPDDGHRLPAYISWPPEGYVMDNLVYERWSFHLITAKYVFGAGRNFDEAQVRVSEWDTGKEVPSKIVHRSRRNGGFTLYTSTIVWEVNVPKPGTGDNHTGNSEDVSYKVEITGIANFKDSDGEDKTSISYAVTLIDESTIRPQTAQHLPLHKRHTQLLPAISIDPNCALKE